jgi:hypothetical protein
VYDTFLSHTSIVTEIWVTNEYTNLGVSSADAYRGDWGAYVSNRADAAYLMASAASSVAGATNLVIGAEETSYDPETRTIYSPAGTGSGSGDVYGASRAYTTLALDGGTALVSRASGRWLMIEADNGEVTLDVDAASYTNALEAIQHNVMWIRGTNETYAIVTNNIDNTLFVDLPASTTNHLFLERRPGWPRFQIWQDFR